MIKQAPERGFLMKRKGNEMTDVDHILEALKCNLETAEAIAYVMHDYINPPNYSEASLRSLKRDFLLVAELHGLSVEKA